MKAEEILDVDLCLMDSTPPCRGSDGVLVEPGGKWGMVLGILKGPSNLGGQGYSNWGSNFKGQSNWAGVIQIGAL